MVNILIPSCELEFFEDSYYPKTLCEVASKPLIQAVTENLSGVRDHHFVYVFQQSACDQYHIDNVAELASEGKNTIIRLSGDTAGPLCSGLMAIQFINTEDELLISADDQLIDVDPEEILQQFRTKDLDCGVACFENLHPRWSYVKIDPETDEIVETSEKQPISKKAIAGLYYFKHGREFIDAAKSALIKGNHHEGKYYLSFAVNEMVLKNSKVGYFDLPDDAYHSFYAEDKMKEYEKR